MLCSWCSINYSEQCLEHNSLYVEVVPIFVCSEFCPVLYVLDPKRFHKNYREGALALESNSNRDFLPGYPLSNHLEFSFRD